MNALSCPSDLLGLGQCLALPVAYRPAVRPSDGSRSGHRGQLRGARWLAARGPIALSVILRVCVNLDVARSIGAFVAKSAHYIAATARAALFPLSAGIPNCPPFLKGNQELDVPQPCVPPMGVVGEKLRVQSLLSKVLPSLLSCSLWIGGIPRALVCARFLAVRSTPRTHIGASLLNAIFGVSHDDPPRKGRLVRDGIGVSAPVPFRLYHQSLGSAV